MSALPWFPCFPKDFLDDRRTKRMDAEQVGVYWLLLMDEWSNGPLPDVDDELEAIGRASIASVRQVLERCFKKTHAGWENKKLEAIRAEQYAKHAKRVHAGKLGGLAKAKQRSSNATAMLQQCSTNQNQKKKKKKDTGDKSPERALNVENSGPMEWGDFAGWFRTVGHKLLWQGEEPPDWAHDDKPWTMERDLSALRQLEKRGEPLDALKAVIEATKDAICMRYYYQAGRWDRYYLAKEEVRKAEESGSNQVGAILRSMAG